MAPVFQITLRIQNSNGEMNIEDKRIRNLGGLPEEEYLLN